MKPEPRSLEALRTEALAALQQGRTIESLTLLRELVARRPDDDIARNNVGCVLLELERPEEAVEVLGPGEGRGNPALLKTLGYALLQQGELRDAERLLRRVLEANPEDSDARNHLGLTLLRRDRLQEAVLEFTRVVREHASKVEAWINLGCAHRRRRDADGARSAFERALRIDPYNVDGHNNLGCVLRDQGHIAEAIEELQIAVTLEPRNPSIHLNLALCLRHAKRAREASSHLRRYLRYGHQESQLDTVHRLLRELEAEVKQPEENRSWVG
ncbi:MAG: tetratricopeptide repeat protein [Planctomycetota bacterium]